ncbi:hypothetical protein M441DRAFT_56877 [Trichoderma asperellum CBS 433.97]|uniref:Uncharacterized protein n=1 Tax=Trichoderma asperellum (strain ATCC 204424 / CBS 433.97 / NBRC 101777) TaxID=1042311 RepID=A0A2T3ZBC9_TRIA4|nr:hypothetical protein M441DRAFT_56877 [Trichoderma asperellum CBS 433.97]PTB42080.1 hypothetical protein M441DRAFT_56877 [Trichoderma asperellum CBS 433.97]
MTLKGACMYVDAQSGYLGRDGVRGSASGATAIGDWRCWWWIVGLTVIYVWLREAYSMDLYERFGL